MASTDYATNFQAILYKYSDKFVGPCEPHDHPDLFTILDSHSEFISSEMAIGLCQGGILRGELPPIIACRPSERKVVIGFHPDDKYVSVVKIALENGGYTATHVAAYRQEKYRLAGEVLFPSDQSHAGTAMRENLDAVPDPDEKKKRRYGPQKSPNARGGRWNR